MDNLTVRILGAPWRLEMVPRSDQRLIEAGNAWGVTKTGEQLLVVATGMSEGACRATLFHELMHAVDLECGADNLSEAQVERVSRVLLAVLWDNPALVTALGLCGGTDG